MADDIDKHVPWTPEGADLLRRAADGLRRAVDAHTAAVLAADGDVERVFAANDALLPALLAYADAQLDHTGTGYPLGALHELSQDDDLSVEIPDGVSTISVVGRHDYAVTDEAAVLEAGRLAYANAWPDDSREAAEADVSHVGRALYQIAHGGGWDELSEIDGLEPLGGITAVVEQADVLGADPEEWEAHLPIVDSPVLYSQLDVYR